MVLGMLLAGLRRCEVLGLRFADAQVADRRLAVMEGKGCHHRIVPAADRFFDELGAYLHHERPGGAPTDRVFVVLKGPRRGLPLSAEGLDEILDGARRRAGLEHATCHAQLLPLGWLAAAMAFRRRHQCAGLPAKVPSVATMRTAPMASRNPAHRPDRRRDQPQGSLRYRMCLLAVG